MAAETYIYHVPLQSGSARSLYRAEMPAGILEEQVQLIRTFLERGPRIAVPTPSLPGYFFAASGTSRVAEFVIYSQEPRGPVLRGALAVKRPERPDVVPALWSTLLETSELPVHPAAEKQPEMPWYATQLTQRSRDLPVPERRQVEEYAAVLPWAWVEYWRRRREATAT